MIKGAKKEAAVCSEGLSYAKIYDKVLA